MSASLPASPRPIFLLFLVALVVTTLAGRGWATDASRVAIVRPVTLDAVVREAMTRMAAEMGAAGFSVVWVGAPRGTEPRAALEQAASQTGAFAAVLMLRLPAGPSADVWVVDRVTGKTVIRTVDVRAGKDAPAALAIRTVELLRASLLELEMRAPAHAEGSAGGKAVPGDVSQWMRAPPAGGRLELAVGASVLASAGGVPPGLGPMVRASYGPELGPSARLVLAGPSFGPSLSSSAGTAEVRQELLVLEGAHVWPLGTRWTGAALAGLGAYHLQATGTPTTSPGRSDGAWAMAFAFGLGAGVRLDERWTAVLDAQAVVLAPRPVLAIGDERLGSAGRPSVLGSLGLALAL